MLKEGKYELILFRHPLQSAFLREEGSLKGALKSKNEGSLKSMISITDLQHQLALFGKEQEVQSY